MGSISYFMENTKTGGLYNIDVYKPAELQFSINEIFSEFQIFPMLITVQTCE